MLVMTLLAKGKKKHLRIRRDQRCGRRPRYESARDQGRPEVEPFTQNLLSNAPEYALSVVQSPFRARSPDPLYCLS